MTKAEILAWITDILESNFEIKREDITPEAQIYSDLGIDSIDAVDLMVTLKSKTGTRLQPEVFKAVRTVQDVVDAIYDAMQSTK